MNHRYSAPPEMQNPPARSGSSPPAGRACQPRIATLPYKCRCRSHALRCAPPRCRLDSGWLSHQPFAARLDKLPSPYRSRSVIHPVHASKPAFDFVSTIQICPRRARSIREGSSSTRAYFGVRPDRHSSAVEIRLDRSRFRARSRPSRTRERTRRDIPRVRASGRAK